MTGKTHAMIGANVAWVLVFTDLPLDPWLVPLGAFAALLPDLDASESMAKHLEFSIGSRRSHMGIKPLAPVGMVLSGLFRHRGWLHSAVALVVVVAGSIALLGRFGPAFPIVASLGYFSHLLADGLTKSGIQFFLPFRKSVGLLPRFLRVRTGGILDMALFLAGALMLVALVVRIARSQTPISF